MSDKRRVNSDGRVFMGHSTISSGKSIRKNIQVQKTLTKKKKRERMGE